MSLLAYISTNHNNNNNNNSHLYYHHYDSYQTPTPASPHAVSNHSSPYSQSRFSIPPQRHDQEGAHSRELESLTVSGRRLTQRLCPSYSGWLLRNHDKFSTPQMADELRFAAEDLYQQRVPQKQQQLLDPASLAHFADNEEDISPTRLPSIQTLLTTASTSAPSAPATSESGSVSNPSIAPSVSSTPTAAAEGIARSSISSNTSSNSTASAPARLSPTMTTTSTTSTPTAQSGYDPASGSTPQPRSVRVLQASSASMAAAAAMQMPTSAYPQPPPQQQHQQQQFMYPGPLPAMAVGPQIHPPPLPPHYMAAPPPQPYYIPAPQAAQSMYPAAATPYGLPPHPALAHQHPALRPMPLGPGMPLPMGHGMPGMPAGQTHLSPLKPKRKRATQHQVNRLNEVFQQTFFPSTEQRLELSRELSMTPRTVQIWFQNRRQGWRAESRRTSGGESHGSHSDQQHHHQQQHHHHGHMPGEGMEGEYDVSE